MIGFNIKLQSLFNGTVTSSGTTSSNLDVSQGGGSPLFLLVNARAGGTNDVTITVEHSYASGSGFEAVPASALFDPANGSAFAFDAVGATASSQYCGIVTQQLRRYVRVSMTGTTLSGHNFAVSVATQHLNSESL